LIDSHLPPLSPSPIVQCVLWNGFSKIEDDTKGYE
jgi:hypothetical protein